MSSPVFRISTLNPYNITGRCLNKEWFAVPMPVVWNILSDYLFFISHAYELKIHLLLLMGNHFHLIASSPTGSLSEAMQFFMAQTSRVFAKESKRINHIWGARFHRTEITSQIYFLNAYKYNYRNPVTAGIVENVEDYRYSTLHGLLGSSHLTIPVVEDVTLFSDIEGTLRWLNTKPSSENHEAMGKALRRRIIELPKVDSRPHPLEFDLM